MAVSQHVSMRRPRVGRIASGAGPDAGWARAVPLPAELVEDVPAGRNGAR
jgi:hypothetical protein